MTEPNSSHPKPGTEHLIEAWFRPMDLNLHITSNTAAIIQAAETSFGRFGSALPVETPDFTFRLFKHDLDDGQPGQPIFRREGHLLFQTIGRDSMLVADLARGFSFGYFSATTLANPAYFRWHFLELCQERFFCGQKQRFRNGHFR